MYNIRSNFKNTIHVLDHIQDLYKKHVTDKNKSESITYNNWSSFHTYLLRIVITISLFA